MAILLIDDLKRLGRPTTADGALTATCIEEAEQLDVKPVLGAELYKAAGSETSARMGDLLDGCDYRDCNNVLHTCNGLRKALAYYAYARLVRATGYGRLTRYSLVQADNDWSHQSDPKERQDAYDEAFSIADKYMQEVVAMLRCNRDKYPEYRNKGVKNNRINFKMIGR